MAAPGFSRLSKAKQEIELAFLRIKDVRNFRFDENTLDVLEANAANMTHDQRVVAYGSMKKIEKRVDQFLKAFNELIKEHYPQDREVVIDGFKVAVRTSYAAEVDLDKVADVIAHKVAARTGQDVGELVVEIKEKISKPVTTYTLDGFAVAEYIASGDIEENDLKRLRKVKSRALSVTEV